MKSIRMLLLAAAFSPLAAFASANDATTHFNAIASGDLQILQRQYADTVVFEWVGGPLDGTYVGAAKVAELWGKFTKGNPNLQVKVADLQESANPKGTTVTANVLFSGKNMIKVRYVLTFRDGKITSETWQIDPKLAL
jgi:ketosteroid isomerase-like protein